MSDYVAVIGQTLKGERSTLVVGRPPTTAPPCDRCGLHAGASIELAAGAYCRLCLNELTVLGATLEQAHDLISGLAVTRAEELEDNPADPPGTI